MICPKCQSRSAVYNTRHSTDERNRIHIPAQFKKLDEQFTWRAHKCPKCLHTFQSVEVTTDLFHRLERRTRELVVDSIIKQLRGEND